ncbi:MAG: glycosyltransferase family 9 protein [Ignavibacteria bacterium]|jgi:ADP-heptose:LPS heptosyltransferase|nr:glycosyltransferase family 9 protein [Ignavibacteria bacterium]
MKDILSALRQTKNLKILVSRTDKIGDVILTLPVINEIKRLLPDSFVYFLISRRLENLLDGYRDVGKLIYTEDFNASDMKQFIQDNNITVSVSVFPEKSLAFTFYKAGIKHRAGTAYRWYSFLYNHRIKEHRKYAVKHESDYNLNLLSFLTDDISYEKKFYFMYSEGEYENLKSRLLQNGFNIEKPFVIIHPGSKGSAIDLPLPVLIEFHKQAAEKFGEYNFVLTGIEQEKGITNQFVKTENTSDLAGLIDLREMMILTDKCRLFISNSTGPIHIAGALNIDIIGFYPNSAPMNSVRWKPLSDNPVIITPADGDDMSAISAGKIMESAEKILGS